MCSYDDSSPVGRNKPLELLEREITELASHIYAATCRWLGLFAEFDRRDGWADWGCRWHVAAMRTRGIDHDACVQRSTERMDLAYAVDAMLEIAPPCRSSAAEVAVGV